MKFWRENRGAAWCEDDRTAGRLAGIRIRGKAECALYASAPIHEPERVERPARLFWTPDDLDGVQG